MSSEDKVTMRKAAPDDAAKWDSIVESSPHGSVYHTWPWVSAMAKHGWMKMMGENNKPVFHPLIAEHDGADIGLIPLYEFKGRILNYIYSPPPHSAVTVLGPCLKFPDNLKQSSWEKLHRGFHNAVDDYLKGLKADCVLIHTPPGYDDMRPYLWLGYGVTPLYNYSLDLRRPLESILQGVRKDFRNRVRSAEKEGYVIVEGSFSDVEVLYEQQCRRYSEQDMHMNVTLDYLKDLWDNLGAGRLKILKAELNGEYVNSSLLTCYHGKVSAWMGCTKNAQEGGSSNYLLHWETIKWAATHGYTEYENIWAQEERLNQFKTKTNPQLNSYYSVARMSRPLSMAYEVKKFVKGGKIWGAGL